jgi:hypothetical protein
LPFLVVYLRHSVPSNKNGRHRAHFAKSVKCGREQG